MIKKILTYLLSVLILSACHDSLDVVVPNSVNADGVVQITLEIPGIVTETTRSEDFEYAVRNITVFTYFGDGQNNNAAQIVNISSDSQKNIYPNRFEPVGDNKYRVTFKLNKELVGKTDLRFYFLANSNEDIGESTTEFQLTTILVSSVCTVSENGIPVCFVMCGSTTSEEMLDVSSVPLKRNSSKVSVSNKVPTAEEEVIFYPFEVFGSAEMSPRMASLNGGTGSPVRTTSYPEYIDDERPRYQYLHPTSNQENENQEDENIIGGKCFIITKAEFNGTSYYYRLDFVKRNSEGITERYVDIISNHWYQFIVLEVTGAGYPSPSEAALHPENGIKYEIHDHSPESYNMASDGYRELGVSHIIEYDGLFNQNDEWSGKKLFIKFFSKYDDDIPGLNGVKALLTVEDESWLELSEPELESNEDITGGSGYQTDHNDTGKIYSLKLRFRQNDQIGNLYNKITVRWEGLEREVPVVWERSFKGAEVSSSVLTMNYAGNSIEIGDYWGYLSSTDDPENLLYSENNLWGVQTEANNGKIRNQGFHFPVMYGTEGDLATYSYTLAFNQHEKFKKDNIVSMEANVTGDDNVSCSMINDTGAYPSFAITRNNNDSYSYKTGSISFSFTFRDNSKAVYSFQTYHTGFFHKDSQRHRLDEQDSGNYYYYEVIPVKIGTKQRYMLDRNLGAKSAQDYIRDSDGGTITGNPAAAGGYYSVAYQEYKDNGGATYKDPVLYDDTNDRVSPPGYRVPLKNAWDAIRLSPSFHTEAHGSIFPAYYVTDNPTIGNVYFPKAMFYNNLTIMGESRSGYYWTGTAATGTEKEEIGKWLSMLVMTGNSTSYVNGCVMVKDNSLAYGASVRCINDVEDDYSIKRTAFNVTGATHVFLYQIDENGQRIPTTAWPGHSIGNYATMTDNRWFGFSYESSQFSPEDLYVIFNFVDEKNIIYTFSHDSDDNTQCTTALSPDACMGWKVIGDRNHNIIPSSDHTTSDDIELMPADMTALGNWWRCGGRTSDSPFVYDYKLKNPSYKKLYIVGKATTAEWEPADAVPVPMIEEQLYVYKGYLSSGMFRALSNIKNGWPPYSYSPPQQGTEIPLTGINQGIMKYDKTDYNWKVIYNGNYKLTFDIKNMKFSAEYLYDINIPEGKIRIFANNSDTEWDPIYIYYWNTSGNDNYGNEWPGTAMWPVVIDNTFDNLFYWDIPESAEYVIFNNGTGGNGRQTIDLKLSEYTMDEGNRSYTFNDISSLLK